MKILTLCILALCVGIAAQAQSTIANLTITLTDVQSVKLGEVSQQGLSRVIQERTPDNTLQMLSRSASLVKAIHSKSAEYEKLYKELSSKFGFEAAYANAFVAGDKRSSNTKGTAPSHIVYQIDPR